MVRSFVSLKPCHACNLSVLGEHKIKAGFLPGDMTTLHNVTAIEMQTSVWVYPCVVFQHV